MSRAALVLVLFLLGPAHTAAWGRNPAPPAEKLSSSLRLAVRSFLSEGPAGQATSEVDSFDATRMGVVADASVLHADFMGRAQLYIDVDRVDDDLVDALGRMGVVVERVATFRPLIQARVALSELERVAALPAVRHVRLAEYGRMNAGTVQTEGDAVIRADRVRNELKITGAGIRVGVIADGIGVLAASIFRGEIPATGVTSLSFRADGNISAGSEGTAILEIIHDVAPDARLFFANFQTSIEFMAAQNWLADRTDLIIDSVSFFNQGPYNGTSPISAHTASMVARGVSYFTAVGNFADKHHQSLFADTNNNTYHEFGQPTSAGETLNITLFPNSHVEVFLQWDDTFGSSGNNYDLLLTDPNDPAMVINGIASRGVQDGNDDPVESITINYLGSAPATFGIAVQRVGTVTAKNLELFFTGRRFQLDEFIVAANSVPNNNDAGGGVLAIGAMDHRSSGGIEAFSSRGPTNDGRLKPDFVAPDGVSTSVPGFGTFFGTSAAAAHAAGVGALILSASPNLAPAQVAGFLRAGAVELGDLGPDNLFGFGRIDAFRPVETLVTLPASAFFSSIDLPAAAAVSAEGATTPGSSGSITRSLGSNFEVAGWALASRGVQKVEVLLDGAVVARATHGLPRLDVCAIFTNFPGCPNVGLVTQLSNVSAGNHSLALKITDNTGNVAVQPETPRKITVEPSSITAFVDSPTPNASVGANFNVRGWAVSNLGIRSVELFIDGLLVRQATYGTPRQDVCNVFPTSLGCPGVGFTGDLTGIAAGLHQLLVRFTDQGGGMTQKTLTINVTATVVRVNIDAPAEAATVESSFEVNGWGIATDSISRIEILVDDAVVMNATLGIPRPDVCQVFPGFPQCPNVGFRAMLTGVAAGAHKITARAVSMTGNSISSSINVTVSAPTGGDDGGGGGGGGSDVISGAIDLPAAGTVTPAFNVSGWAVATQGVKRVDILLDGAVVGTATLGAAARPDVCAIFTGFPGCPNVGITAGVTATAGMHTLQIRVVDNKDATAVFPATPIDLVVSGSTISVPAGIYNGTTSQGQPVKITVGPGNRISARDMILNATCSGSAVRLINASSIQLSNGAFSTAGPIEADNPILTQGTFTATATFDPGTVVPSSKTFNGTLKVILTKSTSGACTSETVTWSASP